MVVGQTSVKIAPADTVVAVMVYVPRRFVQAAVEHETEEIPLPGIVELTGLETAVATVQLPPSVQVWPLTVVNGFARLELGSAPLTPPAALLARFTVEKFMSDVNSEPPLRVSLKR